MCYVDVVVLMSFDDYGTLDNTHDLIATHERVCMCSGMMYLSFYGQWIQTFWSCGNVVVVQ
jgi:hypothetical protein